jgi:2-polyprenyl-6-methoxyphenol hydroxylase-like FAD-dependent oxidoreductase
LNNFCRAVGDHSYACLAFKSEGEANPLSHSKENFEKEFEALQWEVPRLLSSMKKCDQCYFNSIAQVRMSTWSKERVVLIGDAAHSTQGMGASLAMVGGYVLAREIEGQEGITLKPLIGMKRLSVIGLKLHKI